MPQLHLYVPEETAKRLRAQARERNISLSSYLAEIVKHATQTGWPEDYLEQVIGGWVGEPLTRPEPLELEERDFL